MASANEFDLIVPPELARWPKRIAEHDPTDAFRKLAHRQATVRLETRIKTEK